MTEVYLALGSNVGDTQATIAQATELLSQVLQGTKQAPLYISKAVGYTDQPDFLNTAVSGQTDLSPEALLARINNIEQQLGRVQRFHWGPREIDIDIVFYGDRILESEQLTLPHPHFRKRDFVLRPLCDLNPQLIDPVSHKSIGQLLAKIEPSQRSIF